MAQIACDGISQITSEAFRVKEILLNEQKEEFKETFMSKGKWFYDLCQYFAE